MLVNAKAEEQTSARTESYLNRDTVSDSLHASVRLENCADKLAALWNETSFSGDNGAHSSTQCGTQKLF